MEKLSNLNFAEKFGLEVRSVRKRKKFTLADLAAKCECGLSNLGKIENGGGQAVKFELLQRIAKELDIHLFQFFAGAEGVDLVFLDSLSKTERELILMLRNGDEALRYATYTAARSLTNKLQNKIP